MYKLNVNKTKIKLSFCDGPTSYSTRESEGSGVDKVRKKTKVKVNFDCKLCTKNIVYFVQLFSFMWSQRKCKFDQPETP